jgi:hypothetical protein
MRAFLLLLPLLAAAPSARAQVGYGDKGIFPVYETSGQWVVFDKRPSKTGPALAKGKRFLVIGTEGEQLFEVARASGTYGGACRDHKPAKIRAALLQGPRRAVGRPLIAIAVPAKFALKQSRARYLALKSQVGETTYAGLLQPIRDAAAADIQSEKFKLAAEESAEPGGPATPVKAERIQTKIDFGAKLSVKGLRDAFVLVEESAFGASTRRCMRLADGDRLVGDCAEMPRVLMAETERLQFVAYDPSGKGSPYLLALTKTTPKWGDERWGFIVRDSGPRLFLFDAMDPDCRAGF